MAQALIERSCELQVLRQQLEGQIPQQKNETSTTRLLQTDQLDEVSVCVKTFQNKEVDTRREWGNENKGCK